MPEEIELTLEKLWCYCKRRNWDGDVLKELLLEKGVDVDDDYEKSGTRRN